MSEAWAARVHRVIARLPRPVGWTLKRVYWLLLLRWPAGAAELRARWSSRAPHGYLEKLQYKMARDRRPLLTTLADKLAAKRYVAERLGEHLVPRVFAEASHGGGIPWGSLPREFVVKVTHGCRGMVVVSDAADPAARLPEAGAQVAWSSFHVRPEVADPARITALCDQWLGLSYGWNPGHYVEWVYSKVPRRVFVEEYLGGSLGLARNLKIHCFHGVPSTMLVSSLTDNFVEEVEQRFLVGESRAAAECAGMPEAELLKLFGQTSILAAATDLVRVDWLLTEAGPRFGEFTNYPGGGFVEPGAALTLSPEEVSELYARTWTVPRKYR